MTINSDETKACYDMVVLLILSLDVQQTGQSKEAVFYMTNLNRQQTISTQLSKFQWNIICSISTLR